MFMKDIFGIVVGAVGTALGVFGIVKSVQLEKKLDNITKSIDDISDDVDLTVPEDIVKVAMTTAANKECEKAAKKACDRVTEDINQQVRDAVNKAHKDIEADLKKALEEKISLETLENVERLAAKDIVRKISPVYSAPSDIASIIRSCTEAGMTSYDISRVIESMRKGGGQV